MLPATTRGPSAASSMQLRMMMVKIVYLKAGLCTRAYTAARGRLSGENRNRERPCRSS